jgi:photosystem I P700 chlorophyll a apoprotein A2
VNLLKLLLNKVQRGLYMATRFPKFSQVLSEDPTTRRIWYSIATAHDLESHDDVTEEVLYQRIFASHFGHLAIIFLWTAGNLFHVAWQGNFEQWILNPLKVKPIAHGIWDPHFGESALKAFTRGGVIYPVNIALSVFINGGTLLEFEQIKIYT